MGHCGPVDPCYQCRKTYTEDPNWAEDPKRPGSFILDRTRKTIQRERRALRQLPSHLRLPIPTESRRQAKRRASAKRRRTS